MHNFAIRLGLLFATYLSLTLIFIRDDIFTPLVWLLAMIPWVGLMIFTLMAWFPGTRVDRFINRICQSSEDDVNFWRYMWWRSLLVLGTFEFYALAKPSGLNALIAVALFAITVWVWFPRNSRGPRTSTSKIDPATKQQWTEYCDSLPDTWILGSGRYAVTMKKDPRIPGLYIGDISHWR